MKKIREYFLKSKLITDMNDRYHKVHVTRHKIHLPELIKLLFSQIQKDDLSSKANDMAFNFLLSVFPGIIFLFTLIPYIPIPDMTAKVMGYLPGLMPQSLYDTVATTIYDIIAHPRSGLLSLGFILALYSAMNGVNSMMEAFNKCYHASEKRSFITKRLYALMLTIVLTFVLILSTILLLIGEVVLGFIISKGILYDHLSIILINITRYGTVIITLYISIAAIYRWGPSAGKHWHFLSYGAALATILIIIASTGFSYYLSNFATYNKLYGSIGTLIALMLWMMIISFVILIGFELNACIDFLKISNERARLRTEQEELNKRKTLEE